MNTVHLKGSLKEVMAVVRRDINDKIYKMRRDLGNNPQLKDFERRIEVLRKQRDGIAKQLEQQRIEPLQRELKALNDRHDEIGRELAFVITADERKALRTKIQSLMRDVETMRQKHAKKK
jgi:predicted  nucleic acid-binding Zn-ribbon protein